MMDIGEDIPDMTSGDSHDMQPGQSNPNIVSLDAFPSDAELDVFRERIPADNEVEGYKIRDMIPSRELLTSPLKKSDWPRSELEGGVTP
jgi:hypothetical protein